MDTKPCGGKGRGRGRGKERSPAPLVQLTLEEKEKGSETSESNNGTADDMLAEDFKTGSPRGRGIGRGRGQTRGPSRALLEQGTEPGTSLVHDEKFQDTEEFAMSSKKTDDISGQGSPVSDVHKAVAEESHQEGGQVRVVSETQEVAAGESHQDAQITSVGQVTVAGESNRDGQVPPVSEGQVAASKEGHQEDRQVPPVPEVDEAAARGSPQEDGHGMKLASTSSIEGVETIPEGKVVNCTEEKAKGIRGELVEIQMHYFNVKLRDGHPGVAEYHVSTEPVVEHLETISSLLKTQEAYDFLGKMQILDGKILYIFTILPGSDVVSFCTSFEGVKYTVSLELMDIKDLNESPLFINSLLGNLMCHLGYKKTGDHFYDPTMEKVLPNHRISIWPGIDLTAEYQKESFKVTVEFTRLILQQQNVLEQLAKLRGDPQIRSKFEKLIKGKIVITKYNLKCYKIMNVAWDLRPTTNFLTRGQEKISYKDHLKELDKITITDDEQPLLLTKVDSCGNDACKQCRSKRIIGLIPELCFIVGLTEGQQSKLKVMTDLMEATNEFFEKHETKPATFVNRVLGDRSARYSFRNCGLHFTSAEETPKVEVGQDV